MTYCNQEFDAQVLHAAQRALRHSRDLGGEVWHADYACDAAGGGFVVRAHWDPALGAYLVDTSQGKR